MNPREFLARVADVQADPVGAAGFYTLDRVDAKTAALLNHVSIMMAILIVTSLQASRHSGFYMALRFEIVIYLIIALVCLRGIGISVAGNGDGADELDRRLIYVLHRVRAFRISLAATVVTTVAFVITLGLEPVFR